jgi:MoaD family protein
MNITINYLSQIKQLTGLDSEERVCAGGTGLCELLAEIACGYDEKLSRYLFEDSNELRKSLVVLINGNVIAKESPPQLSDGDEITLLNPVGGG